MQGVTAGSRFIAAPREQTELIKLVGPFQANDDAEESSALRRRKAATAAAYRLVRNRVLSLNRLRQDLNRGAAEMLVEELANST